MSLPGFTLQRALRARWPLVACLLAVVVVGVESASAQDESTPVGDYEIRHYTSEDGLPVDGVTDLVFDSEGYLWISTFDGLSRFDGVQFRNFQAVDTPELGSGRLLALETDAEGAVWAFPQLAPPCRFGPEGVQSLGQDRGLGAEYALSFLGDVHGDPLVGTWNGLRRFDGARLQPVLPDSLSFDAQVLYRDDTGAVWVGSKDRGVVRLRDGEVLQFTEGSGLPSGLVRAFCDGPGGSVWIGTSEGLAVFRDGRIDELTVDGLPREDVRALVASKDRSTVWMLGSLGVYRIRQGTAERLNEIRNEVRPFLRLDGDGRIWSSDGGLVYCDGRVVLETPSLVREVLPASDGSIWVATNRHGLYLLSPKRHRMLLEEFSCYPILEDRHGTFWIGTLRDGLFRYRGDRAEPVASPRSIQALHEDPDGTLWMGTPGGLLVLDGEDWRPVAWGNEPRAVPVFAIHRDRNGVLWVGSGSGLHCLTDAGWEHHLVQQGEVAEYVRTFLEAPDGSLWMGLRNGGVVRHRNGKFERWTTASGLPSNDIRALHLDSDGVLWVGTEAHGLVRLDPGGSPEVVSVSTRDGLHDYVVNRILEDDQGRFWISSNRGVYWVLRSSLEAFVRGEVRSVHSVLGSPRIETNGGVEPAGIRARDGRLWFPTVQGVLVLEPAREDGNAHPTVHIESITAGDTTLVATQRMRPPLGRREFEIAYSAPEFRSPQNLRFRYRLAGLTDSWIDAGPRRVAYFTHVPPGVYRFEVVASESPASWETVPTTAEIVVPAHVYETAWFRGGALVLLVGLGFVAYRARMAGVVRRQRQLANMVSERTRELRREKEIVEQQAKRLQELDVAKSRFYANVSHEFRTPLTLTLGPLEDLLSGLRGELSDEVRDDLKTATRSSRRLLRLVNQILDLAKVEAGHLEAQRHTGDLVGHLREVAQDFVPLAERRRLRFELAAPEEPVWVAFDRGLLSQVFLNLIDNAFKYTPEGGEVRVEIRPEAGAGRVHVAVRDTGPGIPAHELPRIFERFHQVDETGGRLRPGTGIGLALTHELVELHEGSIVVESRPGGGSTFTVTLPTTVAPPLSQESGEARPGAISTGRYRPDTELLAPSLEGTATVSESFDPENETGDCTILVVEDNPELRAYLARHLAREYRVRTAADGAEGLDAIRRELPDLVISDVLMPELSGYELVREVRRDPAIAFVPIILLTARASLDDTVQGLEAGAEDYVLKPFRVQEVQARIQAVLGSRRRLRERLLQERVPTPAPVPAGVVSEDDRFLERVRQAVEAGFPDEEFSVQVLAETVGVNRSHLFRRLRELGAPSPSEMIREVRLERAAGLLRARTGNVGEIAYGVGFRSLAHFSRAFRERYGVPPSQFAERAPKS